MRHQASLYFIQAGGPDGPIKIGLATHPLGRLHALQTANAEPLKLLGVMSIDPRRMGCRRVEIQVHNRFADGRIRGEWFRACLEIFQFIELHCDENRLPSSADDYFFDHLEVA